jgi:hypothetical protein
MLTIADFSRKIIYDLNKTFPKASLQGKYVVVESDPNSVSIVNVTLKLYHIPVKK